jgi:hypothetical protein
MNIPVFERRKPLECLYITNTLNKNVTEQPSKVNKQVSIDDDCLPHCRRCLLKIQIPRSVKKPFMSQIISSQFMVQSTVAVVYKHNASTPTAVTVAESFVCFLVCCVVENKMLLPGSCRRFYNVLVGTLSPQMLTAQSIGT